MKRWVSVFLLFVCLAASGQAQDPVGIPEIDVLVESALQVHQMPGAVVLISSHHRPVHFKAYGFMQLEPERIEMRTDTVFDLASLTKPIATATSMLQLMEQGKIDLSLPVAHYLPEFAQNGKESVTVEQLLTHTSGLIADNALRDYTDGKAAAWKSICALPLTAPPGTKFTYSDVGFITLGFLIEKVSGQALDEYTTQHIFAPLKLHETGYLPNESLQLRAAPADKEGDAWLKGRVHDPRCAAMGGVAGHAGLFSTAADLDRFSQMILNDGELDGVRVLKPETVAAMLVSRPVPGGGVRTWGWDRQTGFSNNRGKGMSDRSIGHGGFTGTGLWIDPEQKLAVIFLSNRLHPHGKGAVNTLIGNIGTAAIKQLHDQPQP